MCAVLLFVVDCCDSVRSSCSPYCPSVGSTSTADPSRRQASSCFPLAVLPLLLFVLLFLLILLSIKLNYFIGDNYYKISATSQQVSPSVAVWHSINHRII